eukprot:g31683.t1
MPFGMKKASATFQRLMNKVVVGLTNCTIYIDELVIFSHSWKDHMVHLAELFERLREAKLVINLAKTEFAKEEVTWKDDREGCEHEGQPGISKTILEER